MSKSRLLGQESHLILGLLTSQKDERYRIDVVEQIASGVAPLEILERFSAFEIAGARASILKAAESGISCCAIGEPEYPELLAQIYDPPPILFYLGALECLTKPKVAIVGSRSADRNGCDIARELSQKLAASNVSVVSGLALGIDGAAHGGALSSGSKGATIAVLGNGLPDIYPRRHEHLAQEIIEQGGCILSQFEPGTAAFPSNFLNRNRVIAGLSLGVLVVQADLRSGSLVTARFANEEGRDVLAIPGGINDARHKGTNSLIRQGAAMITDISDIFEAIPALGVQPQAKLDRSSEIPDPRLGKLKQFADGTPHDLVEVERSVEIGEAELLELELQGLIERLPGNQIRVV